MQFRLRTLLIVLAVGPVVLALAGLTVSRITAELRRPPHVPEIPRDAPAGVRGVHVIPVESET